MDFSIKPFKIKSKVNKSINPLTIVENSQEDTTDSLQFDELVKQGIADAEMGNTGKALNLFSRAIIMNDKDYKLCDMIAQLHLMQHRPYGAIKFAEKSVSLNPKWCEGYVTLARSQRELGEVSLSIQSYINAVSLFDTVNGIDDKEKNEVRQELRELTAIYNNYKEKYGELNGRAHVVDNVSDFLSEHTEYSSIRETWKEEIKQSEFEMKEREEEKKNQGMEVEE